MRHFAFVLQMLLVCSSLVAGRMVQTDHFQILFDHGSEQTASHIASFVEEEYDQILSYLDWEREDDSKIRIACTSRDDLANASYSSFPQNHILISDTDYGLALDVWDDQIRGVVRHELFHYLSLSMQNRIWSVIGDVFGDIYKPVYLQQARSLTEGSAVAYERGRLLDPRYQAMLLEAKREGKLPRRYLDMSGLRDTAPNGDLTYTYAGAFWAWVRETYGSKAYGNFLHATNNALFPVDFASLFPRFFGDSLNQAFEAFKEHIPLVDVEHHVEGIPDLDRLYDCRNDHVLTGRSSDGTLRYDGKMMAMIPGLVEAELDGTGHKVLAVAKTQNGSTTERALYCMQEDGMHKLLDRGVLEAAWLEGGIATITWEGGRQHLNLPDRSIALSLRLHELVGYQDDSLAAVARVDGRWMILLIPTEGNATGYPLEEGMVPASLLYDGNRLWFTWAKEGTLLRAGYLENGRIWVMAKDEEGGVARASESFVQQSWFDHDALGAWKKEDVRWREMAAFPASVQIGEEKKLLPMQSQKIPLSLYMKGTFLPLATSVRLGGGTHVSRSQDTAVGLFWHTADLAGSWHLCLGSGWQSGAREMVGLFSLSGFWYGPSLSWELGGQASLGGNLDSHGTLSFSCGDLSLSLGGAAYRKEEAHGVTGTLSFSLGRYAQMGFHPLSVGGVELVPSLTFERQWPDESCWRNLGFQLTARVPRLLPFETYGVDIWNWPLTYRASVCPSRDTYFRHQVSILLYGREIQRALPWVRIYCYRIGLYAGVSERYQGDMENDFGLFSPPEHLSRKRTLFLSCDVGLSINNRALYQYVVLSAILRYKMDEARPWSVGLGISLA